jgi:carbon starvation protein CstA
MSSSSFEARRRTAMRSEMDIMRMDERQRLHWLEANRATLIVVGLVWLLMIAFELIEGRTPGFLIVMTPIFAAVTVGFYYYYARDRDVMWVEPVLFIVLFGFGHWLATAVSWVGEFSTGGLLGFFPEEPAHSIWSAAIRVLEFPLLSVVRVVDPYEHHNWILVMVLNSLLWASLAFLGFRAARSRGLARDRRAAGRSEV